MILSRFLRHLAAALLLALLAAPPALLGLAPARATVNSTNNKIIALGDGVTTTFSFSFIGVASQYISVILTDASGNETVLTQGAGTTQYQITLNAPVTGAVWGLGGSVTYNPSGTPIPSGSTLTIFRTLPLTQAISLQNQNSLARLGNGAETGLDIGVMQGQQISEDISRAIKAPIVDATPPADLPPIAQRANKGAAFDGQGNLVAGTTPTSGVISSAMQPVVNAASLAAGRAAFGLGAMALEGIGSGLQDDGAGNARVNSALVSVATSQSVDATFARKVFVVTGPVNFNLARANTLWNGFEFEVYIVGNALTLIPNANDQVQDQASGTSLLIPANSYARIMTDAAASGQWRIEWSPWAVGGAANQFLRDVQQEAVNNLLIVNNAGVPNTRVDVSFNSAVLLNSSARAIRTSGAFTIDATTVGVNGLDTGSLQASTWYYVWAISNVSQIGGLLSLSSSAPTLPTGYAFKKYLGAIRTGASVNFFRTRQINNRAQYQIVGGTNTATMPQIATGSTGGSMTIPSVTSVVPPTASAIDVSVQINGGTSDIAGAAPNGSYGTTILATSAPPLLIQPGAALNAARTASFLLEGTAIGYFSTTTLAAIYCLGWTDKLT